MISALRVANRVIASKSQFVEAASVSPGEKRSMGTFVKELTSTVKSLKYVPDAGEMIDIIDSAWGIERQYNNNEYPDDDGHDGILADRLFVLKELSKAKKSSGTQHKEAVAEILKEVKTSLLKKDGEWETSFRASQTRFLTVLELIERAAFLSAGDLESAAHSLLDYTPPPLLKQLSEDFEKNRTTEWKKALAEEKKEKSRKEKSSGIRFVTDRGVFFAPEGTATVVKLEGDVGQFFGPASWEEYAAGPDSEELPSAAKSAWKKSLALKDQFKYVHYMAGYEAEEQVLVVFSNAPLKKMSTAIDDARHFYDPRGLKVPGPGMIFFNLDH